VRQIFATRVWPIALSTDRAGSAFHARMAAAASTARAPPGGPPPRRARPIEPILLIHGGGASTVSGRSLPCRAGSPTSRPRPEVGRSRACLRERFIPAYNASLTRRPPQPRLRPAPRGRVPPVASATKRCALPRPDNVVILEHVACRLIATRPGRHTCAGHALAPSAAPQPEDARVRLPEIDDQARARVPPGGTPSSPPE
jgi:hypothetical protein